ncbi:MAG: divalent-cation tolerance protein CutA [Candidatus Nanohaloarchaea archaeon]|nr:divalent-cation tolerance protein CutA [Candidatus Nanohaloarchaea archaeon]
MSELKLFYVTFPDGDALGEVRDSVLENKLAACVNYLKVNSSYLWNGDIEEGEEVVALFKTSEEKSEDLKQFIREAHPYDIPCILEIPVEANQSYEEWIKGEV